MSIDHKLEKLRAAMRAKGIEAYIIPSDDPHKSEYVAERWAVREWISGFTGSAGTAVVTLDHAGVWTDSRYYIQAEKELANSEFELHKMINQGMDEFVDWLVDNLDAGAAVGVNDLQFSPAQVASYRKKFEASNIQLVTGLDLIGKIWEDRPALPKDPVYEIASAFTGEERKEKLERIREVMRSEHCDYHLVATLDDICWILNLRGADVDYNPVFHAFLLVGLEESILFIDEQKVPVTLVEILAKEHIRLKPYGHVLAYLEELKDTAVLIDRSAINNRLFEALDGCEWVHTDLPSRKMKAIKNDTEVGHIRRAMAKDGVALTRFYRWLESTVRTTPVSEAQAAEKLAWFRSQQEGYKGESFSAIVGFRGNGAIVHYRPEHDSCADITGEGMLLIDSGGQYIDGTTDITRTTYLGTPSEEHRRAYTLVLKGHIALGRARFPRGTKGVQLDILARQFLWEEGLNYGHGTGHGVGFFLNVHEPPQGVVPGLGQRGTTPFEPGMFTSNEPGFYKTDEYGIRIENLVLAVEDRKTDYGDFMHFESLTVFPIDKDLIEMPLMTPGEIAWLNSYHRKVLSMISPMLEPEEVQWLEEKCAPLNPV